MIRAALSSIIALIAFVAPSKINAQPLQVLWMDPQQGPICAGPLGPGPCQMVAQWIAQHGTQSVGIPLPNSLPTRLSVQPGGNVPSIDSIPALDASISSQAVEGAKQCAQLTSQNAQPDFNTFLTCTHGALVLDHDSATLVNCAEQANGSTSNLAKCAGRGIIASKLTADQLKAVDCAQSNNDTAGDFAQCLGRSLLNSRLTGEQRQLLSCASSSGGDTTTFAGCAGQAMFGNRITPEAKAAINCATQSNGDYLQFGGCAANSFLNLKLNPEQQIALSCVVQSGGQPYVAAGCTAGKLTTRELQKCIDHGIGGSDGCFGDNNDLVGRNGFVVRNVAALAGGPNSVIRDPGQVLGGPNSVFNNPRQLLGGPNSAVNVVLRNVPSPPPIEVGKIGNHRVCIPWC